MSENLLSDEAAKHLWERYRLRRGPRALQQMRLDGGGPPYHRDGNSVLYPRSSLVAWAVAKLGKPLRSTVEETARRQRAAAATP